MNKNECEIFLLELGALICVASFIFSGMAVVAYWGMLSEFLGEGGTVFLAVLVGLLEYLVPIAFAVFLWREASFRRGKSLEGNDFAVRSVDVVSSRYLRLVMLVIVGLILLLLGIQDFISSLSQALFIMQLEPPFPYGWNWWITGPLAFFVQCILGASLILKRSEVAEFLGGYET